jgi:hypothetical protein
MQRGIIMLLIYFTLVMSDQNQARNGAKTGEDISGSEDTYPHQDTISSPENGENRAQNGACKGSEGSEDIFHTFSGEGPN